VPVRSELVSDIRFECQDVRDGVPTGVDGCVGGGGGGGGGFLLFLWEMQIFFVVGGGGGGGGVYHGVVGYCFVHVRTCR